MFAFLLMFCAFSHYNYAQSFFCWEGTIQEVNGKGVEFAHIQINTIGKHYLFMSNEVGNVKIQYSNSQPSDSLIISCIGYVDMKMSVNTLKEKNNIILENAVYQIGEVIIKPRKCKIVTLGNKKSINIGSAQIPFNGQRALYIQNPSIDGKIVSVKIHMTDGYKVKGSKHRPFRLRLYEGHPMDGKELLDNEIIASLPASKRNWVTINLSQFNLNMPANGITVSVEALSVNFYINHGYIDNVFLKSGVTYFIAVGWSFDGLYGSKGVESWNFLEYKGWYQPQTTNNFLYKINIEVCD